MMMMMMMMLLLLTLMIAVLFFVERHELCEECVEVVPRVEQQRDVKRIVLEMRIGESKNEMRIG